MKPWLGMGIYLDRRRLERLSILFHRENHVEIEGYGATVNYDGIAANQGEF
jgi:hypothetical protein